MLLVIRWIDINKAVIVCIYVCVYPSTFFVFSFYYCQSFCRECHSHAKFVFIYFLALFTHTHQCHKTCEHRFVDPLLFSYFIDFEQKDNTFMKSIKMLINIVFSTMVMVLPIEICNSFRFELNYYCRKLPHITWNHSSSFKSGFFFISISIYING